MPPRMVTQASSPRSVLSNRVSSARIPRVCIAIQAATPAEMMARAERAARESDLLELRLDALKAPAAAAGPLREFLRSSPQTLVIATCRKQTYGGNFRGSAEAEWEILREAATAGCALVDLELQSAERLNESALDQLRQKASLILSYHDYETTAGLPALWERMQAIPADMYKLATTARTWRHNAEMIRLVEAHGGDQALVAFCMGDIGMASRILSLRSGGAFTFAALGAGEETAPGQPSLDELRHQYRVDALSRGTRVYGVLGYPLQHSLSPRMHNAAFRRSGFNGVYLPLASRRPAEVLDFAEEIPLSGMSVTHPHKSAFLDQLERMDPLAEAVGAVNTVVRSQGKLYGYNTDVAGVVEPLGQAVPLRGAKILVIGAGGAARAAVFGLRSRGAHVFIHNRTRPRAQALATAAKAKVVGRPELKKMEFAAIVHATPVGQYPKVKESPLAADEILAPVIFDLVYNPYETQLAKLARAKGARVIPGMEMFVYQGARQFELWTGKPAPVEEMRREVLAALQEPASAQGT